ncbi:TPA: hypothetical protein ACSK82_000690, partial [Listeria innocua]
QIIKNVNDIAAELQIPRIHNIEINVKTSLGNLSEISFKNRSKSPLHKVIKMQNRLIIILVNNIISITSFFF